MTWESIPDGCEFKVYLKHGTSSAETVHSVKTELDESEFSKVCVILSHLEDGILKNVEGCTKDVARYISGKTGYSEDDILDIIDRFCTIDITCDEYMAKVSKIEVYMYKDGKVTWREL